MRLAQWSPSISFLRKTDCSFTAHVYKYNMRGCPAKQISDSFCSRGIPFYIIFIFAAMGERPQTCMPVTIVSHLRACLNSCRSSRSFLAEQGRPGLLHRQAGDIILPVLCHFPDHLQKTGDPELFFLIPQENFQNSPILPEGI